MRASGEEVDTAKIAIRSAAAILALLVPLATAVPTAEPSPIQQVSGLLERYDEDPSRIDRARDVLEATIASPTDPSAEVLILLARVYFLIGDLRASDDAARIAAFDRGREVAAKAVALAPDSAAAHLWYAIDLGRFAQTKGVVRSVMILPTLRAEIDTILRLDPRCGEAHVLAGVLLRELPRLLGGNLDESETHLRRAVALDPHRTGYRIELARLLLVLHRDSEARAAIERVLSEEHPTDAPYAALRDRPAAREMLAALR